MKNQLTPLQKAFIVASTTYLIITYLIAVYA